MSKDQLERFWSKVDKQGPDECWEWLACKTTGGRGQFWIDYRMYGAHRVSWYLTYGPIPKGLFVCHHCDNPSCVNTAHLFLGTNQDNMLDASRKGRIARGSRQGSSKLTEEDVYRIRELLKDGQTLQAIADTFGVRQSNISHIKVGRSWAWLEEK